MKNLLLFLLLISVSIYASYAQKNNSVKELKTTTADCSNAIKLPFSKLITYGPTTSPSGSGKIQEISSVKKNDLYSFSEEHNSAWYYFDVNLNGVLVFKITPLNPNDDYDFILYKWTDSNFCDDLLKRKILAVRSNISRTGRGNSAITGLTGNATKLFTSAGIGNQFSKSIDVKKGERYYLVLDNVYPDGAGHTIEIGFEKEIMLTGNVLNEDQQPVKSAEVSLEDSKGNEIFKTTTNKNGDFQINTYVVASKSYNLVVVADSYFIDIRELKTESLSAKNYKINNITTVLPKLKGGKKYNLKGLNFHGDSYTLLPQSNSSLIALFKLMKKNKNMIISIEGHINDPGGFNEVSKPGWGQKLSDLRANAVYEYLIKNGIESERMSKIGYGNKYMLFPNPKSEEEMSKNRRVEINVISVN